MVNIKQFFSNSGTDKIGISLNDYRFDIIYKEKYLKYFPDYDFLDILEISEDLYDEIFQNFSGFGHKLHGYPGFTQSDPRENLEDVNYFDTLLFQMDSEFGGDDNIEIMWGDSGICNFFINHNDLKNLNFSNVLYNWDCY